METKNRKIIRLKNYDYSQAGYYFVTICVLGHVCCFGEIIEGKMVLNQYGKIVEKFWKEIPLHYQSIELDVYQIMPNHIHGIVIIEPVGATIGRPKQKAGNARPYTNLHTIIGSYKNITSKTLHSSGLSNFAWQKYFYDHIIRAEESLDKIREYIVNNPKQWELDAENPKNIIV